MNTWLPKEQWLPAAPVILSAEGGRSSDLLERVMMQFGVATHPRYQPLPGAAAVPATATTPAIPAKGMTTYCKTFVEDVSLAMQVVFPHWVDNVAAGNPVGVGKGHELNINEGLDWLLTHGVQRFGWAQASEIDARAAARRGELSITAWKNPSGHGHTTLVMPPRPGEIVESTYIAQAGMTCFEHGPLTAGFGRVIKPLFLVHP